MCSLRCRGHEPKSTPKSGMKKNQFKKEFPFWNSSLKVENFENWKRKFDCFFRCFETILHRVTCVFSKWTIQALLSCYWINIISSRVNGQWNKIKKCSILQMEQLVESVGVRFLFSINTTTHRVVYIHMFRASTNPHIGAILVSQTEKVTKNVDYIESGLESKSGLGSWILQHF